MPLNMKAEIWLMHLQANEHQTLLANHHKLGEGYTTDSPSEPSYRANPMDTLISDF